MIPREFDYHAPATLPEALGLLDRYGDDAKVLAGGHSLLPMMKMRFATPDHLVDLGTHRRAEGHPRGRRRAAHRRDDHRERAHLVEAGAGQVPAARRGARAISDPQVRYRGTLGGDISHGDPGNDHPALMLVLGASFVLRSSAGERVVPAEGFFVGSYATLLQPGEILTEIRIPVPAAGTGWCYAKLKRKVGDFATAAAAVTLRMSGATVREVAIALTNVGPTALKASAAEDALRGKPFDDAAVAEAARLAMGICDPVADQRGDAEYKTAMAGEMTQRALRTARSRAA
jgi:carbon-monoxide dehydrogenase medium subunit